MNYTFRINIRKSVHKPLSWLGYTAHLQNVNIMLIYGDYFLNILLQPIQTRIITHTHIYLHSYTDSSFTQTPHKPCCSHHPSLWGSAIATCIPLSWEMGVLQLAVCLCCSLQTLMPMQGHPLWDHRHPLRSPCFPPLAIPHWRYLFPWSHSGGRMFSTV